MFSNTKIILVIFLICAISSLQIHGPTIYNLGASPTYAEISCNVEVIILGFSGAIDLYKNTGSRHQLRESLSGTATWSNRDSYAVSLPANPIVLSKADRVEVYEDSGSQFLLLQNISTASSVTSVTISEDESYLLIGFSGKVEIYEWSTSYHKIQDLTHSTDKIDASSMSNDNNYLAYGSDDLNMYIL